MQTKITIQSKINIDKTKVINKNTKFKNNKNYVNFLPIDAPITHHNLGIIIEQRFPKVISDESVIYGTSKTHKYY